jgi:nicotinamide-nucleotide amidase
MQHTTAAILSTGDELVLGQLQDTNARFIAQALTDRGVRVVEIAAVGDDLPTLTATIQRLATSADVLVITGGLGPTDGDLTRAALCAATADTLIDDADQAQSLSDKLTLRGRQVTPRQLRQAQRPSRAKCLPNNFGTAPGLQTTLSINTPAPRTCEIFALPGPPNELMPLWASSVEPALRPASRVSTRLGYVLGLAEADCAARLGTLTARDRTPLLGMTASAGIITLRHRCEGRSEHEAQGLLDADQTAARAALGPHLFATGPTRELPAHTPSITVLAHGLIHALSARNQTLALAESCTAGLLGAELTSVPGASAALVGGVIAYDNSLKQGLLGVPEADLRDHGAVSHQVAGSMATGAIEATGAHWALSITGIAGPSGGMPDKPIGTVWIALAERESDGAVRVIDTRRFLFTGNRHDVRERACVCAMGMVWFALASHPAQAGGPDVRASPPIRLGWEVQRLA